ncbi:MAG: RagB/SusD family nutrient uptake outer membrane protein [Flavobacterium sp.]
MKIIYKNKYYFTVTLLFLLCSSCDDYLDISLPTNSFYEETAFNNDKTTAATINGIYATLSNQAIITDLELYSGLYTDEFTSNQTDFAQQQFYLNNLTAINAPSYWASFYPLLYQTNLIIEGLSKTKAVLGNKDQYLGEVYFMRAYFFFYLTNIYGDIAMPLTSDYKINNTLSRTKQAEVYQQIIADLEKAEALLPDTFRDQLGQETASRSRPNKYAAKALLARVYLYTKNWKKASDEATAILDNMETYSLVAPSDAFLTDSNEVIWSLTSDLNPASYPNFVKEYTTYMGWYTSDDNIEADFAFAPSYLTPSLLNSFEEGDERFQAWTYKVSIDDKEYYVPYKYKSTVSNEESLTLFRLSEIYLIRAEALANLDQDQEAINDLDAVRLRAGLAGTPATSKDEILDAIAKERRVEFFSELGYRFFDLKRTAKIDEVMNAEVKNKKSPATWSSYKASFPIPPSEIYNNPNLKQTTGY